MFILRTGVNSVGVQGSDKDQLVVSGEGVDSVNLTRSLRKKLCHTTTILSVEEVKEKGEEPEKVEKNPEVHSFSYIPQVPVFYQYQLPNPNYYEVVDDPYNCSIM
jgi:carbamoylphosphate synthase small subunit